jgi:hypothetical protein
VQLRALENYKDTTVTWSIVDCNSDCGTISSTGLYTAPPNILAFATLQLPRPLTGITSDLPVG